MLQFPKPRYTPSLSGDYGDYKGWDAVPLCSRRPQRAETPTTES